MIRPTPSLRRSARPERTDVVGNATGMAIDPDRSAADRPPCTDCLELIAKWLEALGADAREQGNTRDDELNVSCTVDGEYRFAVSRLDAAYPSEGGP